MKNLLIFILLFLICKNSIFTYAKMVDKIVAIVNDDVILDSDVKKLANLLNFNNEYYDSKLLDDKLYKNVLDELILKKIILRFKEKSNIIITKKEVDKTINNIADKLNISTEQLHINLNNKNINYDNYYNLIREEMLINEIRNKVLQNRIFILPEEIDSLVNESINEIDETVNFNLNYIIINMPKLPTSDHINFANKLAKLLIQTNLEKEIYTSFKDIKIIKFSGWKKIIDLPSIFAENLRKSKSGDIIGPISFNSGLHIIKINDIKDEKQIMLSKKVRTRHIFIKNSKFINKNKILNELNNAMNLINNKNVDFDMIIKQMLKEKIIFEIEDLGWNLMNQMSLYFINALSNLEKGKSTVVKSSQGWYLIQLVDVKYINNFSNIRDTIFNTLNNRKFLEEVENLNHQCMSNVYLKKF